MHTLTVLCDKLVFKNYSAAYLINSSLGAVN